jgi:uncharacterized iron-regulated membrane protein
MGMKLSPHAFTRFWDLHAWAGVLAGLVLFLMFLTGGITLFHEQLEVWEDPLAQRSASAPSELQRSLDGAFTAHGSVPDDLWFYPPKNGRGEARIGFQDGEVWKDFWIDSKTGQLTPQRERLAHFIYGLHFLWHDVTGEWLYYFAGILAVAFLLALVTGVLIHLKDILRQFHQFRPAKSRRVLWSDMHKVLGVMGLPFQLMYAYTGAFIVLAPLLLKTFTGPVFGWDAKRAEAIAWGSADNGSTSPGAAATGLSLDELVARAASVRPDFVPEYFHLTHHGRSNGVVEVRGHDAGTPRALVKVRLRASDGELLEDARQGEASAATQRWINGLHFAYFGGPSLRLLFFLLALASCATILTGNWVWLARRARSRGNEVLARLTVGVGAGTWVALGALFLASRLYPLDWAWRGAAEEITFLAVLASCIGWALLVRDGATLWWRQLAVAACLFLPVPLLAARWSVAGLFGPGPHVPSVLAIDIGVLATAVALGASAVSLRRVTLRRNQQDEAGSVVQEEDASTTPVQQEVVLAHTGGPDA